MNRRKYETKEQYILNEVKRLNPHWYNVLENEWRVYATNEVLKEYSRNAIEADRDKKIEELFNLSSNK